jgi:UDP-glucose 4-epimerase
VRFSRADVRRARQELGYEPAVTFEDGLKKTVAWYLETSGVRRRSVAA